MMQEHQKDQKEKKRQLSSTKGKMKIDYKCGQCDAKFTQKNDYIDHVKLHSDQKKSGKLSGTRYNVKPHETFCLKCEKDFMSPLKLKKHYKKVHNKN